MESGWCAACYSTSLFQQPRRLFTYVNHVLTMSLRCLVMGPCHGSMTTPGAVIADRIWTHLCASIWHQRTLCSAPSKVKILNKNALTRMVIPAPRTTASCFNFYFFSAEIVCGVSPVTLSVQMVWNLNAIVCLPSQCASWICRQVEARWQTATPTSLPAVNCWSCCSGRGCNVSHTPHKSQ